jgi:endonuclease/exonuclease/phosphatase family metal-dependent hydrolase
MLSAHRFILTSLTLVVFLTSAAATEEFRLRLVAANLSSGNGQDYQAPGLRLLDASNADVVMIQEFNRGSNSAADFRSMVDTTFGSEFHYYREDGAQIPTGIISRYPILEAGEWDDPSVSNRDFAWARIDIPGDIDLWAVSVNFLTTGTSVRNTEAINLVNYIKAVVPESAYLVIGGDFNTDSRSEAAFTTLGQVVTTSGPYPADQNGNTNTNAGRSRPYDGVYVNGDLHGYATGVVMGNSVFSNGLVLDSRVYSPLSEISPVLSGDSGASNMQHMAVIRDFLVPIPEPSTGVLCIVTVAWAASRRRR